jgi:hypothetical protein
MGFAEFYYIAGGLIFGLLVAVEVTVIADKQPNFQLARWCAILAAILFGSIGIVWGITTPESIWLRLPTVGLVGLVAAVSLSETLRFVMKREMVREPASLAAPSEKTSTGSSFMKIGQGASVEGLTIQRGQIEGVDTVFDVNGKLKDVNLQDFKSSSVGSNPAAHIKDMRIKRVTFAAPKVGTVQPTFPTNVRNSDGTVLSSMSFTVDEGVTVDLVIGMKDGGLIDYAMFQDDKLIPSLSALTKDGWSLRRLDKAKGTYVAKIRRTSDIPSLNVGIQEGKRH